MNEFSWRTRRENLARLAREQFDILIIGGGITGAGLALDAAARGYSVALLEKRDFAAGTSSRSTKLIHGGLRYLEHFEFSLVREGLHERALLTKLAPHLAEPFPFVVPIYQNARRNYDHPLKVRAGLFLYDLLAGRYGLGRHRRLTPEEALALAPQLDERGLRGAFLYYDVRTDDARLVIEVLKTAHARGACLTNYTRLVGFTRDADGLLTGARVRDELTGETSETRARLVINATGVWMDEVRDLGAQASLPADSLDARDQFQPASSPSPQAGMPAHPGGKRVRPSKGIHLLVAAERLPVSAAWLIPSLVAHRFYFVVPWENRVLIGTTDTDYQGDQNAPRAESDEVKEILGAINSYFPAAQLEPADVLATIAGLRPLLTDGAAKSTTAVSREEEVFESASGLLSIAGGKLTTYRLMAERTVDLAARRLRERFGRAANDASTKDISIGGGALSHEELVQLAGEIANTEKLPRETAQHLAHAYGTEARRIVELLRADERLRQPLVDGLPQIAAEIVYAARYELAVTLADALTRRTRLALLAGAASLAAAPLAAELLARELNWNEQELAAQLAAFRAEYEREYATPSI